MDTETRLRDLEGRVRQLEDTLDVIRVVASYGPSVDGGASVEAGRLWSEDGTCDSDGGAEPLRGRAALEKIDGRWQVRSRVNRILDGGPEARELLARGVRESLA